MALHIAQMLNIKSAINYQVLFNNNVHTKKTAVLAEIKCYINVSQLTLVKRKFNNLSPRILNSDSGSSWMYWSITAQEHVQVST